MRCDHGGGWIWITASTTLPPPYWMCPRCGALK